MAHHKSALKRIRSDEEARPQPYQHKTARNAVRKLRTSTDSKEASAMLPWSTRCWTNSPSGIIRKNKAANEVSLSRRGKPLKI